MNNEQEKFQAMRSLRSLAGNLKNKKIEGIEQFTGELKPLTEYLGLNEIQTALFVATFDQSCNDNSVDLKDLSSYFDCSFMEILEYKKDLDSLLEKRLLQKEKKSDDIRSASFKINEEVFSCILDNAPIYLSEIEDSSYDQFVFVQDVNELIENRVNDTISTNKLFEKVVLLEDKNLQYISDSRSFLPIIEERVVFYLMCHETEQSFQKGLNNLEQVNEILGKIFDTPKDRLKLMRLFKNDSANIITEDLLGISKFRGELCFYMTHRGKELFYAENADLYVADECNLDKYKFVKVVSNYIETRSSEDLETKRLFRKINELEIKNESLELVRQLKKMLPHLKDRIFFYQMCNDLFDGATSIDNVLSDIYEERSEISKEKKCFLMENNPLQMKQLAELTKSNIFSNIVIELTDNGKELFLGEDVHLYSKTDNDKNLLSPEKIKMKKLYFDDSLDKQLHFLEDNLAQGNFLKLQERLSNMALPIGIAAILYGPPGTGKTESIYQIAKATGRSVMCVDISQTKSCWFGESEKKIKGVFADYSRLCKKNKLTPILLFNEADAIFGKRKDVSSSNVAQTENAIQNIILEEMERLEGILIATTNLVDNLDAAFERRFLFKVKFEKPNKTAKAQIWKDKLPWLEDNEAGLLSLTYDFSGGEIDNIVRKIAMNELLKGERSSLEELHEYCSQERLSNRKLNRVGFGI